MVQGELHRHLTLTAMGELLKFVFISFLILLILAVAIPLLWLVIKLVCWLFGGMLAGMCLAGGDILTILFIVGCILFIIWCIAS